jgi:hypothetical protein
MGQQGAKLAAAGVLQYSNFNKMCVFVGLKCSKCSKMHGMENVT